MGQSTRRSSGAQRAGIQRAAQPGGLRPATARARVRRADAAWPRLSTGRLRSAAWLRRAAVGGYGAPIPAPTSQQKIGWITFAIVGLLGLLGAVLTLTLWINLDSAVNRAGEMCNRFSGEYASSCRASVKNLVPTLPPVLVVCLFLIIGASLAATAGAVMLFLKSTWGNS